MELKWCCELIDNEKEFQPLFRADGFQFSLSNYYEKTEFSAVIPFDIEKAVFEKKTFRTEF